MSGVATGRRDSALGTRALRRGAEAFLCGVRLFRLRSLEALAQSPEAPPRSPGRDNRVGPRRSGCLRDVAQLGSAPALGAGSREFKSPRPDVPVAVGAGGPVRA